MWGVSEVAAMATDLAEFLGGAVGLALLFKMPLIVGMAITAVALLMLSFVGCALSGLPLIFAEQPWAPVLATAMGGFRGAALIHRISAFVLIVVFVSHVFSVFRRAFVNRSLLSILWGPDGHAYTVSHQTVGIYG